MHIAPILSVALLLAAATAAQTTAEHGARYERLLIRNVHVIDGNGTPITGPTSVIVENDRIARVGGPSRRSEFDAVIDGEGRYLMPGMINLHGHLHDSRPGSSVAMPFQYQFDLWLASGVTTIRDVGSDRKKAVELRAKSAAGEIVAPRILLYMWMGAETPEQAVLEVEKVKADGGDGIKMTGMDRAPLQAAFERAAELDLPIAHHVGVEETDVMDDVMGGTRTIEHWYGVPDAAIPYGSQRFPAGYNYSNELDRFRWAGRLWKESDPERLSWVLQSMVDAGVAWDPTLTIYVAARDATRAQNQPWFEEYLHPALEEFFEPSLESHGSFFLGWTTQDEIEWKQNYRIWFDALREFAERGGVIGTGEDAGFIYQVYGFGFVTELELQQEAGFHPLDVVKHATGNGAKILGLEDELGRVKAGYKADLVLVNGNPLENFKVLYPTGTGVFEDGEYRVGGKVAWTIKDGFCYDAEVLRDEAKEFVREARAEREARAAASRESDDWTVTSHDETEWSAEEVRRYRGVVAGWPEPFGPAAETTAEHWTRIGLWVESWLDDPDSDVGREARLRLISANKAAIPALVNVLLAQDYRTYEGMERGDRAQALLATIANGRNAGWKRGIMPADAVFNAKAVALLAKVWARASTDEAYWKNYTKQD